MKLALLVVAATLVLSGTAALIWRRRALFSLLATALLIALSVYFLLESFGLVHEVYSSEAFLIPGILAGLLLLSSGAEYLMEWRHVSKVVRSPNARILCMVVLLNIGYLCLLPYLGYYLCTLLFMCCLSFVMGNRSHLSLGLVSIAWLVLAFVIFERTLQIPLPEFSVFGG